MLGKIFIISLLGTVFIFPNIAQAIETLRKGAPAQVGGPIVAPQQAPAQNAQAPVKPEDPLTVSNVIIDKTADNAVKAKEQAIGDAYRQAFMKLAARNMTPETLKDFHAPDDKTIAGLVQDFEVQGEKLSSTRYVANYTVRFRSGVRTFIPVAMPQEVLYEDTAEGEAEEKEAAVSSAQPAAAGPAKTYLILPYFENTAGRTLLWEDNNPWRDAWQSEVPPDAANGSKYLVPMGDISDVSAGPADAVWSGDYRAIEKLRAHYKADEVVLAVANKSGAYMTVDMYFFRDGSSLRKREVLQPYVGERSVQESFAMARAEVMKFLEGVKDGEPKPVSKVEAISRELVANSISSAVPVQNGMQVPVTVSPAMTAAAQAVEIETMMSFSSPAAWMDVQKRLSSLTPPVQVNLRSLSKGGAQFVMKYAGGSISDLQKALSDKGLSLTQPAVEINNGAGMKPVYGLSLAN